MEGEISKRAMLNLTRAMDTDNREAKGEGEEGAAVSLALAPARARHLHELNEQKYRGKPKESDIIAQARARINSM